MKRKMMRRILIGIVLASTITPIGVGSSCSQGGYSGKTESINFGAIPSGSAAFIYIAQEQGFFRSNGINVNVIDYNTGVATTDALLKAEADIAFAAEFPMLRRAFAREEIKIITVLNKFTDEYFFGLKDQGIKALSDLKGKVIGVPRNTIAEFYLARLLELNGMKIEDISLIDIQPPQSIDAISSGSIAGVVTWEPYASQIRVQLAERIVVWSVQSGQPGYGVLIARKDWISSYPQIVERFLKSLAKAEDYFIRNPGAARLIVQKRLNYDDASMATVWSETQFGLSLDQSLITAMEDEARWMIASNLTTEKQVPNFLDYIYEGALQAIKPEAVNIIR